jgi:hypothetical protein
MSDGGTTNAGLPGGAPHPRIAVVGSGPLAAEVVRNLALVGIPAAVHRPESFWATLRLVDLQECYCAVAAGIDRQAARRLNQLSQVAGVDFVNVSLGTDGITIESFPFGSDARCACLECTVPADGAEAPRRAPDPIAASVAGALGAATALHCSGHGARRLSMPVLGGAGVATPIARRRGCPACSAPWRAPRVIRTRNRWSARESLAQVAPDLSGQTLRLSDAVVTACECADCGPIDALTDMINRPAAEFAAGVQACPGCGSASVRIEARELFSLGDLMARFGGGPVPAKFALAEIGGATVCFDLEAGTAHEADGAV